MIFSTVQWWHRRSAMALATTGSPNTFAHAPIPTFVVTTVDLLSYLLETSWNSRSAPSLSTSR